ncbi:stage III sporulation protein AG [Gordoniibacillus kamchatkensis]|uniref:Stage III sporulation protein AG n=1 Tax=Gordoniibacillus kamchatkensis TaxID=1590651 RepID=A0ABR5AL71_9BACL|nr:stage III sporulation protein AG [Paenibacillus sp. VKM B-2647]KIL41112.1 stage III sporulation protein AG [Paenibacillus sp. VKM B-2647]
MGKFMNWLEQRFGGGPNGSKRSRPFLWLLIIALIGAAIMILSSFVNVTKLEPISQGGAGPPPAQPSQPAFGSGAKDASRFREYEQAYESQLQDILRKIVGVGDVEVLVTIESTEEVDVEKNVKNTQQVTNEKDQNGANRNITEVTSSGEVVLYQVSGAQQPLVTKYIKPKIRGVLVVAKGAENAVVKKMIAEAVERGLDVPAHRISILPRKQSQ